MKSVIFVLASGLVAAVACGGTLDAKGGCATNADCPSDQRCLFPIGSCDSSGQCVARDSGPMCNSIEELCGCDGIIVETGCGFPDGFASGPTTGASATTCTSH